MFKRRNLGDDVFYDMSVDIGKAKIAPLVAVGELSMIDPKQVEDGGVEVVNMHGIGCPMGILTVGRIACYHPGRSGCNRTRRIARR